MVRPTTDCLTRLVNTKNKSHLLAEAVADGQSHWRDWQREGVHELTEKLNELNGLVRDKSLSLPLDELLENMKQSIRIVALRNSKLNFFSLSTSQSGKSNRRLLLS
jgi:hypothetical protein